MLLFDSLISRVPLWGLGPPGHEALQHLGRRPYGSMGLFTYCISKILAIFDPLPLSASAIYIFF